MQQLALAATRAFGALLILALSVVWLGSPLTPPHGQSEAMAAPSSPFNCGPPPTPEPLWVDPVTSPTTLLTQKLGVRLGNGRTISVASEAGTVGITGTFSSGTPVSVTIPLLTDTLHHLRVIGTVEYATGCSYDLYTTQDRNGNPLIIAQGKPYRAYLPILLRITGPAATREFPDTTYGIFVLNDQLATWSMTEAQFQFAATHYVGTQKVLRADARHLRQYNPNFLVLHYRLGQALGHSVPNASCQPTTNYLSIIDGDQWVREWPGDSNVQESWFFHWNSSRVFKCVDGHYLMELNDSGWREWWSTQVISQLQNNEDDAVFADSYSVPNYFGGSAFTPPLPVISSTFESEWAAHEHAFTDYMRSRFASRWKWIPNIGAYITTRDPSDYSNVDGAMIEGFVEWGGGSYHSLGDWVLQMDRILPLIAANKILIAQTYPNANDVQERLYVLGTYLLIKGARTYINLDIGLEPEWFPEYGIDLGAPVDPLPASISAYFHPTWKVYVRHYAKGLVLVNPTSTTQVINLGATYYRVDPIGGGLVPSDGAAPGSLSYAAVTSLTLSPNRAVILLNQSP